MHFVNQSELHYPNNFRKPILTHSEEQYYNYMAPAKGYINNWYCDSLTLGREESLTPYKETFRRMRD